MEPTQLDGSVAEKQRNASTAQQQPSPTSSQLGSHSRFSSNTESTISTTTDSADEASSPRSRPSLSTILCFCALTLSIFLVALDTVLIPTALPSISLDFHIPDSLYAWTGSAYLLANAASIPFWGKLSDVFGRKPIILISNVIFLGGSLICAVSANATMLVAGRAVQGLGGGGVNVLVYVCVADMFAIRDRSFYMGIVGAMYAVASALGPVIGGVFAQKLNWRWCFYINLPLVSIAIVTLYFTVHRHDMRISFVAGMKSFDWPGTFTILTATVLLLVGLQLGGTSSYRSPLVICFLVFGPVAFVLFPFTQWWNEKRGGSPIMPLRIFRDVSNLSALGVCACDALVFNSVAYFLPLYFQLVLSSSPSTSGVYMLAVAVPLAIVSFLGGWIINKTGHYLEVLQAGLTLMTIGVSLFILFTTSLNLGMIIGFLIIIGIGFGPNFHAPLIALQTRIRESDMAAGTSAFGFVRMVSGAIGVVVGQVVFQLLMKPHYSSFVDAGLSVEFADTLAGGEAISQASRIAQLSETQKSVVREGLNEALRGTWIFFTIVSGLGLCVSFGIARKKLAREEGNGKGKTKDGEMYSVCCRELKSSDADTR
ncbi:MFS general substrate transporter [Lentithecium fluviatile CBS 122367]|uniref:MFS general substrate transporter n=1 Tax=Lentithecium fluviatile CBS 122367 TaxID=1168545 RepID=A0A6G1IIZ0_9PLEO|nr:MFS general substrate transporter [Lentithecium fluviatile CBS 122367]